MGAQNPYFTLKCNNGSIELKVDSALLNNPSQLLEKFLEALEGRQPQVNPSSLCVTGPDIQQLVVNVLQDLTRGRRDLVDVLKVLEGGRIGESSGSSQCNTRSQSAKRYEFLVKTCYGGDRANRFAEMIKKIAGKAFGGIGDCEKCRAALLLLAYYLAAVTRNRGTGCRLEDVLWAGEILRMLAGDARNVISLCPWEGDVVAALYATLAYCSNCLRSGGGNINAATMVTVDGRHALTLQVTLR